VDGDCPEACPGSKATGKETYPLAKEAPDNIFGNPVNGTGIQDVISPVHKKQGHGKHRIRKTSPGFLPVPES
jgi:hypothetical protein